MIVIGKHGKIFPCLLFLYLFCYKKAKSVSPCKNSVSLCAKKAVILRRILEY